MTQRISCLQSNPAQSYRRWTGACVACRCSSFDRDRSSGGLGRCSQQRGPSPAYDERQRWCSSIPVFSGEALSTLAWPRGCFAKLRVAVSLGVRRGLRALRRGVVWMVVHPWRPGRALRGPSQAPAAAIWWLWSFSRLWVAATNRHSDLAAALPRRWKRSMRRLNFVCPKTGSIIAWRFR